MTRINCVPVQELCDQHLIAEYRELPRVFSLSKQCAGIPSSYRMGTGHVKFFYDKLMYLYKRQKNIVQEMLDRGFNPTHTDLQYLLITGDYPNTRWQDWEPDQAALNANRARLAIRMQGMRER